MKKKSIFGCLAIICLLLVLIPPVLTRAEKHSLITWEKKSKNVVSMYLELQEKEAFEEIKAFSLTLNFDSKEDLSEEPVFKFGSDFKGEKVSVHEERYNEEDQTMKLYVAGRDTVLEKGEKVLLGTITIKSDENVTISVDENDFQIVDRFHEKGMITEFGDFEPYEMILKKRKKQPFQKLPFRKQLFRKLRFLHLMRTARMRKRFMSMKSSLKRRRLLSRTVSGCRTKRAGGSLL